MWQMSKQWAMARKGVMIVVAAALLVGSGLGAGLAGGKLTPAGASGSAVVPAVAARAAASADLADLVEQVGNSVVNIKVTKVERTGGRNFIRPEEPGQDSPFGDRKSVV
jgi:multidrug efflux pump subunit AcrB